MGRIDLKQNAGIRPTDMPNGGISDTMGYAQRGMNALERADDRLAAGLKHVSDALFGVSKDMADARNRVEADTAQIEIFKMENADNQKMEADIQSGKIRTPEQFREAYDKLYVAREKRINKYLEDNVSSSRNAELLMLNAKGSAAKNFAHMTGVYINAENRRLWNMTENNCFEFAQNGDDNAAQNIKASVGCLRGRYSGELCDALERKYLNMADTNRLQARIAQGESMIDPEAQKEYYEAVVGDLESGQYDGLYKAQIAKTVAALNKGINAQDYRNELRECAAAFAKDVSKMSEKQFDEWEKSALAELGEKKHLSAAEKKLWGEKISGKRKSLQKSFLENVQAKNRNATIRLLEAARADETGNVDLNYDLLHGQARAKRREEIDINGADFFDNETINVYDRDFHSVMSDISAYKNEKDKDGIQLRNLLFRTQTFTKEHRKMLVNALSDKVNGRVPEKWSSESWDGFKAQIDKMIEWYDVEAKPADEKKQMAEDSKAAAFYQMSNSICKDVERLGLTPIQAQEYLQKHPFYKRLCDKQSYSDAMDFFSGTLKNKPQSQKQANERYNNADDLIMGMFGQYNPKKR